MDTLLKKLEIKHYKIQDQEHQNIMEKLKEVIEMIMKDFIAI